MNPDCIIVRGERPGDEDRIDAVVSRAFGCMDEANLVRMLRARQPGFDRRLSICAWDGNQMVGYTGFIPVDMRLMGGRVPAMAVAPVAVVPGHQGRGIAGMMLRHGHAVGRERGVKLAFLNGHPGYYPRHGYVACFGFCKTVVDHDALPAPSIDLEAWPVRLSDIPWLVECDEREWAEVDFSWPRGSLPAEWSIEGVNAVLWRTRDSRRAAYTLSRPGQRGPGRSLEVILGDDPGLVREVIARLRPGRIDLHPSGWLARHVLEAGWATCEAKASDAAMAIPLVDGVLDEYAAAVESGRHLPGVCNWPVPFMMC